MSYNSNCGQHSQQCLFRTKGESFSVLCGYIERCGESAYSGRGLVYTPLNKYPNSISVMTYNPLDILFKHFILPSGVYFWEKYLWDQMR